LFPYYLLQEIPIAVFTWNVVPVVLLLLLAEEVFTLLTVVMNCCLTVTDMKSSFLVTGLTFYLILM